MNPLDLELVVRQAFGLVVLLALPLVGGAAVSATAAGMLAARVGVTDSSVTLVARALAVVLVLSLTVGAMAEDTLSFTTGLWAGLADVGAGVGP